jgi:hypothetical protein
VENMAKAEDMERVVTAGTTGQILPQPNEAPSSTETEGWKQDEEAAQDDGLESPEDQIRAKAHEIWIQEGYPEGQADRHWHMAAAFIAGNAK